jgi:hypothetical protein
MTKLTPQQWDWLLEAVRGTPYERDFMTTYDQWKADVGPWPDIEEEGEPDYLDFQDLGQPEPRPECWRLGTAVAMAGLYRFMRLLWGHGLPPSYPR